MNSNFIYHLNLCKHKDSIYTFVGYFNTQIIFNDSIYIETENSNSFLFNFNSNNNEIVYFEQLPYKNIFYAHFVNDSSLYFISNYVDEVDYNKRSLSINKLNNESKLHTFKLKTISKNNKQSESTSNFNSIFVYPNINQGDVIKVCCFNKIDEKIDFELFTIDNKNISVNSYKNNSVFDIVPISQIKSGVYYLKVFIQNKEIRNIKIIISN